MFRDIYNHFGNLFSDWPSQDCLFLSLNTGKIFLLVICMLIIGATNKPAGYTFWIDYFVFITMM